MQGKINTGGGGDTKGMYVWLKYKDSTKGEFLAFVTSKDESKYPDKGVKGNYYYEKHSGKSNDFGVFVDEVDSEGNVVNARIIFPKIPTHLIDSNVNGFLYTASSIEVNTTTIDAYGLAYLASEKIKVKATQIAFNAFHGIGRNIGATKVWLSKSCDLSDSVSSTYETGAFDNADDGTDIYCEHESRPSSWGSGWNKYDADESSLTTMYGVTEEAFDAL